MGLGTPWGHHGVGDILGMGNSWGRGHCGDGDSMGTPRGWGLHGDGDTTGMMAAVGGGLGGHRQPAQPPAVTPVTPQAANITELPRAGEASLPFTFFRSYKDGLWRFESAANPGWFLCTSARGHEPLGLSRHPDASHVLDFYFQLC